MKIVEWSENSITILPEVGSQFFLIGGIVFLVMITLVMFITIKAFKRISKNHKRFSSKFGV